jgi:cold shock CspA family protein
VEGVVAEFDEARGLGVVASTDGTTYPFHCTQIADGTRTIEVGTPVRFDVGPGLPGVWEARGVAKAPPG